MALAAGIMVAAVDDRRAPEHKFPLSLPDCIAAVRWIAARGGGWGIDPARLAVGGDSAGGNLALATLLALRDHGHPPLRALYVAAAALDPLLDDSLRLVERLEAAGRPHRFRSWPGLTHASFQMSRRLEPMRGHIAEIGAFLRQAPAPAAAVSP